MELQITFWSELSPTVINTHKWYNCHGKNVTRQVIDLRREPIIMLLNGYIIELAANVLLLYP